ncbi:MAG: thermosome subunit [Thermoplasmata archaeon HGW-Thermoplasmata-1]|nr:MAG: thermosome subunit [Thermoplasmata archaeon HGW-Thermoplasmata-1]
MYAGQQPVIVLKEGTHRERGRGAQGSNIMAARAVADAVRSTLGPKGMDKMLVDSMGDVIITNDGVTILKEIDIAHPAAKMIVEVAKTQDNECGDGTTTAVIFAGELLKEAEALVEQNVHPTMICEGYRIAAEKAVDVLTGIADDITPNDEKRLRLIAETAMTGKSAGSQKKLLAEIAVKACSLVSEKDADGKYSVDIDNIKIEKKQGGSISDSHLIDGIIIDKERVHTGMPKFVENAKILLVDSAVEVKKTEVDAKIQITDPAQLQAFLDEEERMLKKYVEQIKATGANVVMCQKGVDDLAQHYLAKAGIYTVRRVKKSDMEKLAKATGANVVSKLSEAAPEDLGAAGRIEEKKIADDEMTFVTGCPNAKAVSILIRGGTEHVIDEIERALHDALGVVSVAIEDGKMTTGGGSAAMEIALALRDYAPTVGGREQMAIESFANAVEVVPRALSENAGLDAIDILIKLRKAHREGKKNAGVNVMSGEVEDMKALNVLEPLRVGTQAIKSATEVATMILRIDDVIASKGLSKGEGMPGGAPGMGGMGDMM